MRNMAMNHEMFSDADPGIPQLWTNTNRWTSARFSSTASLRPDVHCRSCGSCRSLGALDFPRFSQRFQFQSSHIRRVRETAVENRVPPNVANVHWKNSAGNYPMFTRCSEKPREWMVIGKGWWGRAGSAERLEPSCFEMGMHRLYDGDTMWPCRMIISYPLG